MSSSVKYRISQKTVKKAIVSTVRMFFLICICFVVLYPLFLKISISFMSVTDLYDSSVVFLPKNWTLSNWKLALETLNYGPTILKTFLFTVLISLLQIVASLLIGYGFGRFKFPCKNILFVCVLLTLIIPAENIMLPLYFYFQDFNFWGILGDNGIRLLGTAWPIVLLSCTGCGLRGGLYTYMFKAFFQGMPKELEEAGAIDGAGSFRIFRSIILPAAGPITVTCFLFSFVWQWTDTFYVSTFMPGNSLLQTQIEGLANKIGGLMSSSVGSVDPYYQSIMSNTGVVVLILPIALLYIVAQRYFVESIENTGIVG